MSRQHCPSFSMNYVIYISPHFFLLINGYALWKPYYTKRAKCIGVNGPAKVHKKKGENSFYVKAGSQLVGAATFYPILGMRKRSATSKDCRLGTPCPNYTFFRRLHYMYLIRGEVRHSTSSRIVNICGFGYHLVQEKATC